MCPLMPPPLAQTSLGGLPLDVLLLIAAIAVFGTFMLIGSVMTRRKGNPFSLFVLARFCGSRVSIGQVFSAWWRCPDPRDLISNKISADKADLGIPFDDMVRHVLAGGSLKNVVCGMIAAKAGHVRLSWEQATRADLAGRDLLKEISDHVHNGAP